MSVNDLAAEELTPAELLNEFDVVNIAGTVSLPGCRLHCEY